MADRAGTTALLLLVAALAVSGFFIVFAPAVLASNTLGPVFLLVVSFPIYSYAAYWAFSIRRALAVRLYRNQAFGIGFVVLALYLTIAVFGLIPTTPLQLYAALTNLIFYFLFFVMFYWLDVSILTAHRADPLLRDTLHWSKLRMPLWIANGFTWGTILVLLIIAEITGNVSILNQLDTGSFNSALVTFVYLFPIAVLICGIILLPAITIRSKWDRTLQRHFMWFTPSYAGLIIIFFFGGPPFPSSLRFIVFIVMGYTLYRSAKSLVPMNRISPDSVPKAEPPPP